VSRLRVAVIGAGTWGRNHVRILASLADAELVAICDTSAQRREELRRLFPGVSITETVEEALAPAEAAVIATPAGTHAAGRGISGVN